MRQVKRKKYPSRTQKAKLGKLDSQAHLHNRLIQIPCPKPPIQE
jgi:hypothetical protein